MELITTGICLIWNPMWLVYFLYATIPPTGWTTLKPWKWGVSPSHQTGTQSQGTYFPIRWTTLFFVLLFIRYSTLSAVGRVSLFANQAPVTVKIQAQCLQDNLDSFWYICCSMSAFLIPQHWRMWMDCSKLWVNSHRLGLSMQLSTCCSCGLMDKRSVQDYY